MRERTISATKRLWEVAGSESVDKIGVSSLGPVLPEVFLKGLRNALQAGLTCEEIVSFMDIISGLRIISSSFDGDELIRRTKHLAETMQADINYVKERKELEIRRVSIREAQKKIKKL